MLEHFKIDSLLEVGAKLRQVEKRDGFRNREEKVEQEILDALGAQSIDAAEKLARQCGPERSQLRNRRIKRPF